MKKLIAMMLMLASVFFIACDDDDKEPLSAEDAQQELTNLGTDMAGLMQDMEESEGMEVIMFMNSLPDPFDALSSKSTGDAELFNKIEKYLLPNTIMGKAAVKSNFDFEYYKGIYTYVDAPVPYFEWVDDPNMIQINFPSSETSTTNDAQLTISNYTEVLINDGYDMYYNPTAIDAELTVNGTKYVGINMTADWDSEGEPEDLYVDVYIIPFNFVVDFEMGSTTAKIDANIKYQGTTVFSAGIDATWATSTDEDPETISGYIELYDVKFKATIELKDLMLAMAAMNETSTLDDMENAINNNITASVSVDGAKAADIVADFTNSPAGIPIDEENMIYLDILFVFNDGSSTSAIPYFAAFASELDAFFAIIDEYLSGLDM